MSYRKLLTGSDFNVGAWKPKHADRSGAPSFPMSKWRSIYFNARGNASKAAVVANFKAHYNSWLENVEKRRMAKKLANNAALKAILSAQRAKSRSASVARRTPTPRSPHLRASARHAGSRRSPSLRRMVLTAHVPRNAVARTRANARLTGELQTLVNNLMRNLGRRRHA